MTPQAAHGDDNPGDGLGVDGPTCDPGDPPNWFNAAPIDAAQKRRDCT
jgi:hypothetical protein